MKIFRYIIAICILTIAACGSSSTAKNDAIQVDVTELELDVKGSDQILSDSVIPQDTQSDVLTEDKSEKELESIDPCSTTPRPEGCPCAQPGDCVSYVCVESFKGNMCASLCPGGAECPKGTECKFMSVGGDMMYVCVPLFVHLCQPCYTSNECAPDGTCMTFGNNGMFCLVECSDEIACPAGYTCTLETDDNPEKKHCKPDKGICDCSEQAVKLGLSTKCFNKNSFGICEGTRVCTKDGLSMCDAKEPTEEKCDGTDSNCNGIKDADELSDCCKCGNTICEDFCGESINTCAVDCYTCGNKSCEPGEGPLICPFDCCGWCGDLKCANYEGTNCTEDETCPEDCAGLPCGNGICDKGENPKNCLDCVLYTCGNNACDPGEDLNGENPCEKDCAPSCGNCKCEGTEDFISCPIDCGYCGDGYCSPCAHLNENYKTCPKDCCPSSDYCYINGFCYESWTENPQNQCLECNTTMSAKIWSLKKDGTPCNADDNGCSTEDKCLAGECIAGLSVDCSDFSNQCNVGKCLNVSWNDYECKAQQIPDGNACEDNDPCTIKDKCLSGLCIGTFFPDTDGDGYDSQYCGGFDCDDNNFNIHPGAQEVCDYVDNNCNNDTDEPYSKMDYDKGDFPNTWPGYNPFQCTIASCSDSFSGRILPMGDEDLITIYKEETNDLPMDIKGKVIFKGASGKSFIVCLCWSEIQFCDASLQQCALSNNGAEVIVSVTNNDSWGGDDSSFLDILIKPQTKSSDFSCDLYSIQWSVWE